MTSPHTMQADMNWCAVLAHHATRTPDKAITVFEGETTTYGEMADRAAALAAGLADRGRRAGRRRRRCSPTTAPSSSRRSSPPTTSARSPCRSTGGSPRPRCATSSSTPGPGRSCATTPLVELADEATKGIEATLAAGLHLAGAPRTGGRRWPTCGPPAVPAPHVPRGGRRRPPPHVHVGHDRTAEGRDAHPRQPGLEEPRPHRRVRLHRAPTSGWPAGRSTTSARSTSRPPR